MANNYVTDAPSVGDGAQFASDDIGGTHHPAIKIEYGDEDSATYVSPTNPMPITPGTGVTFELGAGTATIGKLAANDGVDIGNVDVASLPAAQIGQTTIANSLCMVPASNIPDATYIGDVKFGEPIPAGNNNIGNVDIVTLPSGNLGQQLMAASLSIVFASNITDGTYIGDIKFGEQLPSGNNNIGDVDVASLPAGNLGAQVMAASLSTTLATDDTHFGAVGAAADVDGVIHAQLRYLGETAATLDGKVTACNTGAIAGTVTANLGTIAGVSTEFTLSGISDDVAAIELGVQELASCVTATQLQIEIVEDSVGVATETTLAQLDGKVTACNTGAVTIGAALPAGTNNIGDVDVLTMPGTAAESAALPSAFIVIAGDDGTDTHPLQLDASGNLKVNIVAGGGSGGTSMTDDTAFTPATTSVTPAAGVYQSSPDSVDDNDGGAFRMTQQRALYVSHETPNGDSMVDDTNDALKVNIVAGGGSGGTSMTDDAAFTAGSTGITPAGGVYQSTPDTVDDNDGGALRMTQRRALYVSHETPAGDSMVDDTNDALKVNIVAGGGSGGTAMTDDAAFTPATTSITPAGGMFNDTSPDSVDEGDGGVLRMSVRRELYVQLRDAAGNERGLNVDASGNIGVTDAGSSVTVDTTGTSGLEVVQPTAADLNMTEANSAAIAASLDVVDDWDETNRCAVNLISSQTGVAGGSGVDAANVLRVSLATNVTLPAGDNNIGNVDLASAIPAGTNNIGDVDVASLPAANLGQQLMAASLSVVPASNITDATYIGDIKFGEPLPAGTNAIGKLSTNDGVDIGDVDVTSLPSDTFVAETGSLGKGVLIQGDDGTDRHNIQTDSSGYLLTNNQGMAAENDAPVGYPVLIAGRYDASERTLGDGDLGALAVSAQGWLLIGPQSGYLFDGATRCQIKRKSGLCASGTTAILSAVSGKKFRILAFAVFATAANANSFYLATTTDTDVLGESANPLPIAMDADGDNVAGFVLSWNPGGWAETSTANEALNLTLTAAYDVVYCITYIEVA